MKTERIEIRQSDLKEVLLPQLRGRVFHVTTASAFEKIIASGQIDTNHDGRHGFTYPQSEKNWGRLQGYACLFDLRTVSDEDLDDALDKFYILHPADENPVFLFLDTSEHSKLIPWTTAPKYEMLIPHVECWYPTDVLISAIGDALAVTVISDDADSLMRAALRKARDPELWSGGATLEAASVDELERRVKEVVAVATANGFTITEGWDHSRIWKKDDNYRIDLRLERPEKMR